MRKISVNDVEPGTKLAKSIFSSDGKILLASGVKLNKRYIDRLKSCNISEVYIEDELSRDVVIDEVVCEETRQEMKGLVKKIMTNNMFDRGFDVDEVKEMVESVIEELLKNRNVLANLSSIRNLDDYTFEHSVNVCILSLVIGINLSYNLTRLKDLGVGALLHDIGKLRIPDEILKKPFQLTVEEFEEIKKHTLYGYELLKDNENVSIISAYIAFGHHERYDGSGYPLKLKGESIHKCARIVAVADVFDALTTDRVYRKKIKHHEVFEYINSVGLHQFDREIVDAFMKNIAIYPPGTGVVLNTGEKALVIRSNKSMPTRPVVKVVYGSNGDKLVHTYELDLLTHRNVLIVDSCDIA